MNSKKLISVVLSALLLMTSVLCVSAAKPTASISKVTTQASNVLVEVTTEATDGIMTVILTDSTGSKLVDMDQSNVYTTNAQGESIYAFTLSVQPKAYTPLWGSATSLDLVVKVGGNVAEATREFTFYDPTDLVAFYNMLDGAPKEDIYGLFTNDTTDGYYLDYILSYDLTDYLALDDRARSLVEAEIAGWNLATDIAGLSATETLFNGNMDAVIQRATCIDSNVGFDGWKAVVDQAVMDTILDTKVYFNSVTPEAVYDFMVLADVPNLSSDAVIQTTFDGAVLLAAAVELDAVTLNTIFDFYKGEGSVTVDSTKYTTVCNAGKAEDLFRALKAKPSAGKPNNTISQMEENMDDILDEIIEGLSEPAPGPGGGGGGTGSNPTPPKGDQGVSISGNGGNSTPNQSNVDFADLGQAEWARTAIEALAEKGIISGRGDGKFYPNDTVTREELVKIVVTAFGGLDESADADFADVTKDRWSYRYIASANRLDIVTGVGANKFNPAGLMTREDLAVIVYRAAVLAGMKDGSHTLSFTDAGNVAGYAKAAVTQLAGKNIINGMGDGTFAPKTTVTRAQAAKMIYELLAYIGGVN